MSLVGARQSRNAYMSSSSMQAGTGPRVIDDVWMPPVSSGAMFAIELNGLSIQVLPSTVPQAFP